MVYIKIICISFKLWYMFSSIFINLFIYQCNINTICLNKYQNDVWTIKIEHNEIKSVQHLIIKWIFSLKFNIFIYIRYE